MKSGKDLDSVSHVETGIPVFLEQRYNNVSPRGQRLIRDTLDPSPTPTAGFLSRAILHEKTVLSFHKRDQVPSESC